MVPESKQEQLFISDKAGIKPKFFRRDNEYNNVFKKGTIHQEAINSPQAQVPLCSYTRSPGLSSRSRSASLLQLALKGTGGMQKSTLQIFLIQPVHHGLFIYQRIWSKAFVPSQSLVQACLVQRQVARQILHWWRRKAIK